MVCHLSVQLADVASAKALIAFDADINKINSSDKTPYDIAVQKCPAIADLLTGIGGTDRYQVMADRQVQGCEGNHVDMDGTAKLEQSFDLLLDPSVLDMSNGMEQGLSAEGQGAEGQGGQSKEEGEVVVERKLPHIPEGTYSVCRYACILRTYAHYEPP